MLFKSSWLYIPQPMLSFVKYLPTRQYRRFFRYTSFMRKFSKGMIKESVTRGDGKDIMSILLQANASEDPKTRLTNKEVRDQIAYATCSPIIATGRPIDSSLFSGPFFSPDMTRHRTP